MDLVIDANIFMSALIASQGKTFELIFNDGYRLIAPEFIFEELEKYRTEIKEKSGLSDEEFNLFFAIISSIIFVVRKEEFLDKLNEAGKISPDVNDTEYFALALKYNCLIWSNDKKLKNQEKIKVINTTELLIA